MLKKVFLLCCACSFISGFAGYKLVEHPMALQASAVKMSQGAQPIKQLKTTLRMQEQAYHFYATDKGVYVSPAWQDRQFIAYPHNVLSGTVVAINSAMVQGKPELFLVTQHNHAYQLTLTQPVVWRTLPVPDHSHGSYTLHDAFATPTGQYYLATSNGLYWADLETTVPFRATWGAWQYQNNFVDAHFTQLSWLTLPQQSQGALCAFTAHAASCKIDGQWKTLSKPALENRQISSPYQLQQTRSHNMLSSGLKNQLPPELAHCPGITATLNYGNGYLYVFLQNGQYLRYDIQHQQISSGYPASTASAWHGVTPAQAKQIYAAVTYDNGKAYLFLDNGTYLSYDMKSDRVDASGPVSVSTEWRGISDEQAKQIIAAVNYGNGKI